MGVLGQGERNSCLSLTWVSLCLPTPGAEDKIMATLGPSKAQCRLRVTVPAHAFLNHQQPQWLLLPSFRHHFRRPPLPHPLFIPPPSFAFLCRTSHYLKSN